MTRHSKLQANGTLTLRRWKSSEAWVIEAKASKTPLKVEKKRNLTVYAFCMHHSGKLIFAAGAAMLVGCFYFLFKARSAVLTDSIEYKQVNAIVLKNAKVASLCGEPVKLSTVGTWEQRKERGCRTLTVQARGPDGSVVVKAEYALLSEEESRLAPQLRKLPVLKRLYVVGGGQKRVGDLGGGFTIVDDEAVVVQLRATTKMRETLEREAAEHKAAVRRKMAEHYSRRRSRRVVTDDVDDDSDDDSGGAEIEGVFSFEAQLGKLNDSSKKEAGKESH
jgi:hypothetical protein